MEKQVRFDDSEANTKTSKAPNVLFNQDQVIIVSEQDREIFFDALTNPRGPNQKLRNAAESYKTFIAENK